LVNGKNKKAFGIIQRLMDFYGDYMVVGGDNSVIVSWGLH